MAKIRCTATTTAGNPCKAWAVADTEPPICAAHGATGKKPGAPKQNQNALKHGLFTASPQTPLTITAIIDDLHAKQATISAFIDKHMHTETDIEDLVRLLQLHGQNASRLGRLLRDQRALSGEAADGIAGAIGAALDELSTQMGIEL